MTTAAEHRHICRPRVEGEREAEILDATLTLLASVGYGRLTWSSKPALVVDALLRTKEALQAPVVDTGSLREDLMQMACVHGGLTDARSAQVMAGVVTAIQRDPEFAEEFRTRVIAPKIAVIRGIFERARTRGEITADLDLDLLAPALPGIILHRSFVLGFPPDEQTVARVVDEIILPAATRPAVTR